MPVGAPELKGSIIVGLVGEQNFARARRGFAGVRGEATRMSKTLDIARRGWVRFTGALRGGFGILRRVATIGVGAFAALGAGVTLFARKAVMAASSLEDIQTMLRTAFGTAKAAALAFKEAEALSIKTPFTPASVAQGAIFLKQLKVTTGEVADLRKWMGLAADMAGAMKRDFLEAVFAIGFGLSGESDRLKQFGITVRDLLGAGALGKLGQGINVRTIQGAERFLKAMETLIGQRFRGGAASLARTLSGLWSTFKGIAQFLWADIAQAGGQRGLFGQLHLVLDRINKAFQWVRNQQAWKDFTTTLSTGLGDLVGKVRDLITKENVEEWLNNASEAAKNLKKWLEGVGKNASQAAKDARWVFAELRAGLKGDTMGDLKEFSSTWREIGKALRDAKDGMGEFFRDLEKNRPALLEALETASNIAMVGGPLLAGAGVAAKDPRMVVAGAGMFGAGMIGRGYARGELAKAGRKGGPTSATGAAANWAAIAASPTGTFLGDVLGIVRSGKLEAGGSATSTIPGRGFRLRTRASDVIGKHLFGRRFGGWVGQGIKQMAAGLGRAKTPPGQRRTPTGAYELFEDLGPLPGTPGGPPQINVGPIYAQANDPREVARIAGQETERKIGEHYQRRRRTGGAPG